MACASNADNACASRLRVHAHTGSPQALFDACATQGQVEGMKADDMVRQQAASASILGRHRPRAAYRFIRGRAA